MNCVQKGYPWYPDYLLNTTRLDDLKQFGLNVVRLGTMWSGVEPNEGEYNATYVAILKQIVENLSDRGIYVMMDMHQDCLSSSFPPSYDGVPVWLIDSFPPPANPHPWPLESINAWAMNYLTQAVSESFQHIYNNTNNALDKWADFWAHVTINFKDYSSVLGYNLMNEPWVGDYFDRKRLLLPGIAGTQNLQPAYDVINERIRQHDREGIIFYEPVSYGQLFENDLIGAGFDHVPGGVQYRNVSAYSYHMYCLWLEATDSQAPDARKEAARARCENVLLPRIIESTIENVDKTGGGSFLTEFGLCKTSGTEINIECEVFLRLADYYLQSWIEWDYNDRKWYTSDGNRIQSKVTWYVRPYAQAVAGIPSNMEFDPETLDFTIVYDLDPTIDADTEIFVPDEKYVNGYDVSVTSPMEWRVEEEEQKVYVYSDGSLPVGYTVTVTIKPANPQTTSDPSESPKPTSDISGTDSIHVHAHNRYMGLSAVICILSLLCLK